VKKNLVGIIMEMKSCLQDVVRGHWIKMSGSNSTLFRVGLQGPIGLEHVSQHGGIAPS
jgi:hypothetical protein